VQIVVFPGSSPDDAPVTGLAKLSADGKTVRALQTRIRLRPGHKETFGMSVRNPETKQWATVQQITALGYDKLNQFVGISFYKPDHISTGEQGPNQLRPNPYMHRDGDEIVYVQVRFIGIGRNAVGNLVCHDLTITYNLRTYFAQDLWSKWRGRRNDKPKSWGQLFPTVAVPKTELDITHIAVPCPGGVTLVLDLTHPDVIDCFNEHIGRQKFAERNAQTICRRNILRTFLAVAMPNQSDMTVPVVGWIQPDQDLHAIGRIAAAAERGNPLPGGEPVEVVRQAQEVDDKDDIDAALAGQEDEDSRPPFDPADVNEPAGVAPPPAAPPEPQADLQALRAKIRELSRQVGPDATEEALVEHGLSSWQTLSECEDPEVLAGVKTYLEDAKLKTVQKQAFKPAPKPEQQESLLPDDGPMPQMEPPARGSGRSNKSHK